MPARTAGLMIAALGIPGSGRSSVRISAKASTESGPRRTGIRLNPYSSPAESGQRRAIQLLAGQ